jgi:hypothetical protein
MSFSKELDLAKYSSPVFFETGTFLGGGTKLALKCGFQKVITIELQEYLYNQCINGDTSGNGEDLVKEISEGKVEIHLGDSRELMWKLIEPIQEKITFWLDSHIDGGNNRPGITPNVGACPLYEEIETIAKHPRKDHTIMIDDLRIIGSDHSSGYGWGYGVNIDDIKKRILQINPEYKFTYEDGVQHDDILVAYISQ